MKLNRYRHMCFQRKFIPYGGKKSGILLALRNYSHVFVEDYSTVPTERMLRLYEILTRI